MASPGFTQRTERSLSPLQPAKLTDFRLAAALGSGATAKVYDAVHVATGRPVAIKLLDASHASHASHAPEGSQARREVRERFAREAILVAGVNSRHVGAIVGFGFERGQPFLVLERLHGETLDAKLRRDGPVAAPLAARWIEQLLVGVRDCHDQQIIHRDIKPSNIFLHEDECERTVKLIDFGVARVREVVDQSGGLTLANHLLGSMGYMAPEQFFNAKTVDFTADLYALGVVIFRTFTGRLPFVSRSLETVIKMKAEHAPPTVSSMPGMTENALLDWFVGKAMARNPLERFQSAREMLEQWRNVIASMDDDAATDVMRGLAVPGGFVSGILRRSPSSPEALVAEGVEADAIAEPYNNDEDRTLQKLPTSSVMTPAAPPIANTAEISPPEAVSSGDVTELDVGPLVISVASPAEDDEPFDMTTRADSSLRDLVERERALQRKRQSPPG